MPLERSVSFVAVLQKGNRIQVPKVVRWRFKLETDQVLNVSVTPKGAFSGERFYGRMNKSGRITIPKLTLKLLRDHADEEVLPGIVLDVQLNPA